MTILISNLPEHLVDWKTFKTDNENYSHLVKEPFQWIDDNRHKQND